MTHAKLLEYKQKFGIKTNVILRDVDGAGLSGNGGLVERMEFPDTGGIFQHLYGYKFPYKGMPDNVGLDSLGIIKKMFLCFFYVFAKKKSIPFFIIFILLPNFLKRRFIDLLVDFINRFIFNTSGVSNFTTKKERLCKTARELYRGLSVVIDNDKDVLNKKILRLIRTFSFLVLEYDSAYRFRFQDIVYEANYEKLVSKDKKVFLLEIERLLRIVKEREVDGMAYKWEMIIKPIILCLKYLKPLRTYIQKVIKELNFNEIIPDDADDYFNAFRGDYKFKGIPIRNRILRRKNFEGEDWIWYDDLARSMLREWEAKNG